MSVEQSVVYLPKRGRRLWYSIGALIIGGLLAVGEWRKPFLHAAGSSAPLSRNLVVDLGAAALLFSGLLTLLAIIRGVPRLTMNSERLVLQTRFRTTSVPWDRLGPFTTTIFNKGLRGEKLLNARAPILISPARFRLGKRYVSIPNAFEAPFATVLRDLSSWHHGVAAGASAVVEAPERPFGVPGFRFPWLTAVLLIAITVIFVLELRLAVTPPSQAMTPSVKTLTAFGGLSMDLVRSGQWFRLLSAPFLHAGLAHLIGNAVALALAGYALERIIGRAWMFYIFAAGALAGSVTSVLVSAPSTVSVGASGAIMAMLVSLFMIGFRLPAGRLKTRVQIQSARVTVPALIPLGQGTVGMHIDYGAHFGGALLGIVIGLLLLRVWHDAEPLPRFRTAALMFSIVAASCFAGSAYTVSRWYKLYASVQADLIPQTEFSHGIDETISRADGLLAAYPRDPMSHYLYAFARMRRGGLAEAEQELRTSLSLAVARPLIIAPAMVNNFRATLALTVLNQHRRPEAIVIARDVCTVRTDNAITPELAKSLAQGGLCPSASPSPQTQTSQTPH